MRALLIALLVSAGPAYAQSQADYDKLAKALFANMSATYLCRNELGGLAYYQSARSIAVSTMTPIVGSGTAVATIAAFDEKLRNDPRSDNPQFGRGGMQACFEIVDETLFEVRRAKASLGLE